MAPHVLYVVNGSELGPEYPEGLLAIVPLASFLHLTGQLIEAPEREEPDLPYLTKPERFPTKRRHRSTKPKLAPKPVSKPEAPKPEPDTRSRPDRIKSVMVKGSWHSSTTIAEALKEPADKIRWALASMKREGAVLMKSTSAKVRGGRVFSYALPE